jgi:hypothetical protein
MENIMKRPVFSLENTPALHTNRLRSIKETMTVDRENLVKRNNAIREPGAVLNNSEGGKYRKYFVLKG